MPHRNLPSSRIPYFTPDSNFIHVPPFFRWTGPRRFRASPFFQFFFLLLLCFNAMSKMVRVRVDLLLVDGFHELLHCDMSPREGHFRTSRLLHIWCR